MKTIIDFLKKHWFPLVLAAILLSLVVFNLASNCSVKHTENLINQTELQMAINHVKDSMKTADLQAANAKIDSTRRAEQLKTQTANYTAQIHSQAANKYMEKANKLQHELDSLKAIKAPCEQQLDKCEETSDNLYQVIAQNDSTIEDLGTEAEGYSRQLYLCDEQRKNDNQILQGKISLINETNRINDSLKKELKGKDNFFTKNAIWIGVVAGAVGMYLIVK